MSEPIYLHTWGSRRHIAERIDADELNGVALCGGRGKTEVGRFILYPAGTYSPRQRKSILNRPICARCAKLADPAPRTAEQSHLTALAEHDALTARVDVLTRALRQACSDGWADGEGAMARYIEDAERAGGAR